MPKIRGLELCAALLAIFFVVLPLRFCNAVVPRDWSLLPLRLLRVACTVFSLKFLPLSEVEFVLRRKSITYYISFHLISDHLQA